MAATESKATPTAAQLDTIACSVSLFLVGAFQLRRNIGMASISETWFRRTCRNCKPLFNMILALPELGYKEAQHSFSHLLGSRTATWQEKVDLIACDLNRAT